jgi:retron-type reverse transcriptase
MLGVPTPVDRLIRQALHQVLQPFFEPTFSDSSNGFRPGRGAHQAVRQAGLQNLRISMRYTFQQRSILGRWT